ncbi:DUF3800 domain-containing protein [Gracilimonas sediminicola]|uniref:DUF3800 domain-containing protein n=1 Tax=Gracilimonas sediminicola TaxID=2952158 RepID=UPI0038D453EB
MLKELILYADESVKSGEFYSNFYGGCLIRSKDLETVKESLISKAEELHLNSELKWQKVTSQYLDKYFELMNLFFEFVQDDVIKVRVMFMQNNVEAVGIEEYHKEHEYFLLYYQFIKHAFGLPYIPDQEDPIRLRIYFDRLPDTKEKAALFKSHITSLSKAPEFRRVGLVINEDQVAEIDSKKHILLQCTDIILGSMQFRLNNLHKIKPEGSYRRGKRTIAKEKLYKFINRQIRDIYPNFNIGISTGVKGDINNRWHHPYRHWSFVPANHKRDDSKTKRNAP